MRVVIVCMCVCMVSLPAAAGVRVEQLPPLNRAEGHPHQHEEQARELKAFLRDMQRASDEHVIQSLNTTFHEQCGVRADTRLYSGAPSLLAGGALAMVASIYTLLLPLL